MADPTPTPPEGFFYNGTCILFYNEGVDGLVTIYDKENDGKSSKLVPVKTIPFTLPAQPDSPTVPDCPTNKGNRDSATLQLVYTNLGKNVTKVIINLVFSINNDRRFWGISKNSSAKVESPNFPNLNTQLLPYEISAAGGFSYSCSRLTIRSPKATNETLATLSLTFRRFQVQPFESTNPKFKIFADSFDCATWFTIPLWCGLFVTLFFGFIIASAVYMLFDIKTMDRFENPKGKTITVAAGE